MTRWFAGLALTAGLLAPAARAENRSQAGDMIVRDTAKAFTEDGVRKAEKTFTGTTFKAGTEFTVVTYPDVPESKKSDFEAAVKDDRKPKFMREWAADVAKGEKDHGVFVLICMGKGSTVEVLVDRETDTKRGFSDTKCKQVRKFLVDAFKDAKALPEAEARARHDGGLLKATDYVVEELRNTTIPGTGTHRRADAAPANPAPGTDHRSGGTSIMSYVCIGGLALAGIWLVIGLFRALTGGGGGGGYGGGGYGGGGGGGGFMSSMLGGMFGAAAGMYLYDQFSGHHSSDLGATDSSSYDGGAGDTGAGDFDGGAEAGGDYGSGGDGGGDFGGDAGGDFGGGGGDFGGGGGDFGGGDF